MTPKSRVRYYERVMLQRTRTLTHATDTHTEYVQKYASKDSVDEGDKDSDDDDEMSSVGSYDSADDDEAAGMEDI